MRNNILILFYYNSGSDLRQKELDQCMENNIKLNFTKIIIINYNTKEKYFGENITNIIATKQYSFCDLISIYDINKHGEGLLYLTNTDILLDPAIISLENIISYNDFIAISRYSVRLNLESVPHETQDTWVFRTDKLKPLLVRQLNFFPGTLGCDSRLAEIFFNMGYNVYNPCLSIKNVHCHNVENSDFSNSQSRGERLYGTYLFPNPCNINDITESKTNSRLAYFRNDINQ